MGALSMRFLLRLIVNTFALWVAVRIVPGITFTGTPLSLVLVALVFGVVNASIGLVLRIVTFPMTCLTLGLFSLVVNGLLFWLASVVSQDLGLGYHVDGFLPAVLGALVTSITSMILTFILKTAEVQGHRPRD
jgi:putative membrane protein